MALSRLLLLIFLTAADTGSVSVQPSPAWERVFGRLMALEEEYGELAEGRSEEALKNFMANVSDLLPLVQALGEEASPLVRELEAVRDQTARNASPVDMWVSFQRISKFMGISGRVTEFPRSRPNYARADALYAQLCIACHGTRGKITTARVKDFTPAASDFLQSDVMNPLSPIHAYYAISYGEYGSAMPAFASLSEDDRWALAYYVFTFRLPPCETKPVPIPMRRVALSSDNELTASFTGDALSCIRWTSMSNTPRRPKPSGQGGNNRR
jgi:high-affinity iron transporter